MQMTPTLNRCHFIPRDEKTVFDNGYCWIVVFQAMNRYNFVISDFRLKAIYFENFSIAATNLTVWPRSLAWRGVVPTPWHSAPSKLGVFCKATTKTAENGGFLIGAPGRTWTGTTLRSTDFKSAASTNSATGASVKSTRVIQTKIHKCNIKLVFFCKICFAGTASKPGRRLVCACLF